jgi:DNA invertase Pin-like site-specific DNA recombinase
LDGRCSSAASSTRFDGPPGIRNGSHERERVFAEKISGAVTDRKALAKAIAALGAGDVLLVTRLDRLARSTRDLLNVLDAVAKAGAGFRSLADAWADTTTAHGRLMLTVVGGLAEFERELIKARTDEGRKRAQARGIRFGRKLKLTAHQRQEALARREAGEALVEISRSYNVSHSTISRLAEGAECFCVLGSFLLVNLEVVPFDDSVSSIG